MILNLKCSNCGAALEVKEGVSHLSCGYCGVSQIVERDGGAVWLTVEAAIHRVQAGTDRTAAELALQRLSGEHRQILTYLDSLRAKRAGFQSSYVLGYLAIIGVLIFAIFLIGSLIANSMTAAAASVVIVFGVVTWCALAAGIGYGFKRNYETTYEQHSKPIRQWEERETAIRQQIDSNRKIANG